MAVRPYLAFAGNCRDAFTRYQEILGGELVLLGFDDVPPEAGPAPDGVKPDAVMHGALMSDSGLLMGADDPSGHYGGRVHGMCVNLALEDVAEAQRVFAALADGGEVQQPISE